MVIGAANAGVPMKKNEKTIATERILIPIKYFFFNISSSF
jgi:hypothetical protein